MYLLHSFLPLLFALLATDGANVSTPQASGQQTLRQAQYTNPVIQIDAPDPTVIQAADGYFYLYSTGGRNNPIYRSANLVDWTYVGRAYLPGTSPAWEKIGNRIGGLWAPDINRIGNKYVMYYSTSVWGGEQTCGIGVSVADAPQGPFTDRGKLFRSGEIGVRNSIDPFYIEDGGKKYLFWGSFHGIYGIELTPDGLGFHDPSTKKQVAGTAYEGTYIHKHGDYYYLFASTGTCCEGAKSTYTTVVGRSKNLFGPYVDKAGRPMLENHHEIVIHKNNLFVGTGHNSEIVQDKAGSDWMLYHAFPADHPETGRVVLLDRIYWDNDGWPYVIGDTPAGVADAPVF
jgi:arabinan endo-1,5-alpha-L-arabinosidase